jgi:SET domain-containing protein
MMVQGQTFVDARTCPNIKARYINDPLNETAVNCKFVPMDYRSAVVTNRAVEPGEELFASYGDFYWTQRQTTGNRLKPS